MKLGIDLTNVKTMSSRVVVPTGNYPARISGAEVKETNGKNGHYLQVDFQISAGEHKGTNLTQRLNINNPNPEATRIGLQQLKTIATVGGHQNPNYIGDTNELVGLKLNLYVEENETSFTGKDGNEVETTENNIKAFYEYSEESASSSPKKEKASAPVAETPAPWSPPATEAPAPAPTQAQAAPAAQEVAAPAPSAAPAPAAQNFPWLQS